MIEERKTPMGLFTSNCPVCSKEIYWFLKAPKDFACECGRPVSVEEIEASWKENYSGHIAETKKLTLMRAAKTQANNKHGMGGLPKGKGHEPKPITLPKMPWDKDAG